eukprot:CAMPEP_0172492434 /NCGR_PEP_ID=MMETSP1066-20121228/23588_1 /TAXON_ID=671091 /ORGANISM="Coscinodiscus wailesii, Strain CCMP2513" /LENGTH=440 /DNA_ID=CAMNT_0013262061 /DNA_START=270 /DNA_END=1592 /DNA_ORIENTATION=+
MALILAAPATGKTTFVRNNNQNNAFLDGDDIIFNDIGIPPERPDPADWTEDERRTHMKTFLSKIRHTGKICLAFSNVAIDSFHPGEIRTVVVELPDDVYEGRVAARHRTLRAGCGPRPREYYASQRCYLRELAKAHGLGVFSSFDRAVAVLRMGARWSVPADDVGRVRAAIADDGFVVVPGLISRGSVAELATVNAALIASDAVLSKHLVPSVKCPPSSPEAIVSPDLKETIHQYLNPHLKRASVGVTTLPIARRLLPFINGILGVNPSEDQAYLFNDTLLTKTSDHIDCLHWHQDFSFWPLHLDGSAHVIVLWIPLVPVNKESGAISVAIGSHCEQTGPIINLSNGTDAETGIPGQFDESRFRTVCLELNAGDGIIFHPNLFHMSHPNVTEKSRPAWSSVWAHPTETKWDTSRVRTHPRSKEGINGNVLGKFDWGPDEL